MSGTLLGVELIVVLFLTVFLLNKYINCGKVHCIVTISSFIGWYFSFIIVFVLPLDVANTFYHQCQLDVNKTSFHGNSTCEEPGGYVPESVLLNLWRVVYWTAQCLTWLILPMMQSYSQAGEFTTTGKLWTALISNGIYYASYFLLFIFLLIYAAMKGVAINAEHLKVILVSASNTWGLFLLVVLLGYGLVEVPRHVWLHYRLRKAYFELEKLSADKNDAEETARELYSEARHALNALKHEHGLRENAQTILTAFPAELVSQLGESTTADYPNPEAMMNEKYLVRLHKRVLDAVRAEHRTRAQWSQQLRIALHLEDLGQGDANIDCPPVIARLMPASRGLYRLWLLHVQPLLFKMLAIAFSAMSVIIIWSECTFFIVHPTLSLAAAFVHSAAIGYHYLYIKVGAVLLIAYLCMCAYYTVFRLRIYRYYRLDANHMTDENSLLFSAMMSAEHCRLLCRLTPPLCLNFLGMIHLDSHITADSLFRVETQFTKLMGHLDVIPLLAKGINIYLPILITLLCLATWLRLGVRLLHWIGIEQFVEDDEITQESVHAGRALVTLDAPQVQGRSRGFDYSDREPIMAAESDDDLPSTTAFPPRGGYGSSHPPSNMFDDL